MNFSHKDFRWRVLLALLAVVVLVAAGTAVLRAIEKEYRRNIAGHLSSNLESMSRGIALLQQDSVARTRRIAEEPQLRRMAARLIARPDDARNHAEFETWITPFYQSRGFDDYSLISFDGKRVLTAGTQPYIGQLPLPSTRATLHRAELLLGGAVSPPISAARPFSTLSVENPSAMAYQLACAPVDQGIHRLAFLCLHENPSLRLYRLLRDGRPGISGEAYVVDQDGHILSPVRFEKQLAAPPDAEPGWSLFRLQARVMPTNVDNGLADPALLSTEPLTPVVERLLRFDSLETGLFENYADYRGRRVVGAGRWLLDAALGIVVEEDLDEAYRPLYFARHALIALIGLGVFLIVTLTVVDWRSRRSLARSEQQLAAFRDYIPAGLSLKSADGRYLMANPVFEASQQFPPGFVLGKTDAELFPPPEASRLASEHAELVRTGRPIASSFSARDAEGRELVYSTVRFPVWEARGEGVAAVGMVALDISELIRTQRDLEDLTQTLENKVTERTEQLAAARDLAESASRAKAQFLANMSHEIRTPLNAIMGMGYLAAHVNQDERVGHYLERIHASGAHLLGIVNDILDLSKIEAGKFVVKPAEFVLGELLGHVSDLVAEQAGARGLRLAVQVAAGLPDRLVGDAQRIAQILINFANNAVKFTERGSITLRVLERRRAAGEVGLRFEVEDTGIGIAADKLPLLFSPFQQLDSSMSRQFEGSGLGLAISRNLAELMGGSVGVRSRPGEGSVFYLDLALRIAVPGDAKSAVAAVPGGNPLVSPAAVAPPGRLTGGEFLYDRAILLVEDNRINQEVMQGLLEMFGARVSLAGDGVQCLQMLEQERFDLLLMDVHMPNMDGFTATARIRNDRRFSKLPIIALTANALEGDAEHCLSAGMDAYLAKPIEPGRLFAVLARFCSEPPAAPSAWEGTASMERSADASPTATAQDAGYDVDVDDLLARLGNVDGIDVGRALARVCGRRDLYAQLVRRVAAERAELPQALERARQAGDRQLLLEIVHGAKSILGMLGADALQERCVDLQRQLTAPAAGESGGVDAGEEAMLAAFITALAVLLQGVQAAVAPADVTGRCAQYG